VPLGSDESFTFLVANGIRTVSVTVRVTIFGVAEPGAFDVAGAAGDDSEGVAGADVPAEEMSGARSTGSTAVACDARGDPPAAIATPPMHSSTTTAPTTRPPFASG
jgi:hypothetical protein